MVGGRIGWTNVPLLELKDGRRSMPLKKNEPSAQGSNK